MGKRTTGYAEEMGMEVWKKDVCVKREVKRLNEACGLGLR